MLQLFVRCTYSSGRSTFPGFMIPLGSNACLIDHITSRPVFPTISCNNLLLPVPMPCSPVHVPPNAIALSPMAIDTFLQASYSSGFSGSKSKREWKLPSPTCPNKGAVTIILFEVKRTLQKLTFLAASYAQIQIGQKYSKGSKKCYKRNKNCSRIKIASN